MTVELWSFSSTIGVNPAQLRGMSVEARDGGIGKVVDLVDEIGAAYLVVDTGPWIFGKHVMLPAGVIIAVDTAEACVFIDRAKDDVKNAPEHDPHAGDATQRDALTAHYGARQEPAAGAGQESGLAPSAVTPMGLSGEPAGGESDAANPAPYGAGLESVEDAGQRSGTAGVDDAAGPVTPIGVSGEQVPMPEASSAGPAEQVGGESEAPVTWQPPETGEAATTSPGEHDIDASPPSGLETGPVPTGGTDDETGQEERGDGAATRRFARDADSSRGTARKSGAVPIAGYETLTAADVVARLPGLSQRQLAEVERYEKHRESRRTVLGRIESLREKEPWSGYDDETVEQIRKRLSDTDDKQARAVRDYERRHRDRKGVMEAARRAVAHT